jgi:hypothetical protein
MLARLLSLPLENIRVFSHLQWRYLSLIKEEHTSHIVFQFYGGTLNVHAHHLWRAFRLLHTVCCWSSPHLARCFDKMR